MNLLTANRVPALKKMNKAEMLDFFRDLLVEEMTSEKMDKIIELLLDGMSLAFVFNKNFRRNIKNFRAKFAFKSEDGIIGASAIFEPTWFFKTGKMRVDREAVNDADVTISFEDGRAMAEFLFSDNPDLISALLDNKLSFQGNLNYIFKFAYMARHLPRELGIQLQP
jgi:hypothetical protein